MKNSQLQKPIDNEAWMVRLLSRAEEVGLEGEIPVASVVLDKNGHCIGRGVNRRVKDGDPLGHAELIAIRQASWIKNDWRLNDCKLIVTLEPCAMCAGAIIQARVGIVVFGAKDLKRGGLGGSLDLANHKSAHHKIIVQGGIMEAEASSQLKSWFKRHR